MSDKLELVAASRWRHDKVKAALNKVKRGLPFATREAGGVSGVLLR
jgi:hypothetical protein